MIPEISKTQYKENALLFHILKDENTTVENGWFSGVLKSSLGCFVKNNNSTDRVEAIQPKAIKGAWKC